MYFIASGECIVEQKEVLSSKGNINKIAVIGPGKYFGVSIPNLYQSL
jgi:hypothetical protein